MRIGGFCASIVRICTGGGVRAQQLGRHALAGRLKKNVSCISRAGWPSGKFNAVKL